MYYNVTKGYKKIEKTTQKATQYGIIFMLN